MKLILFLILTNKPLQTKIIQYSESTFNIKVVLIFIAISWTFKVIFTVKAQSAKCLAHFEADILKLL